VILQHKLGNSTGKFPSWPHGYALALEHHHENNGFSPHVDDFEKPLGKFSHGG